MAWVSSTSNSEAAGASIKENIRERISFRHVGPLNGEIAIHSVNAPRQTLVSRGVLSKKTLEFMSAFQRIASLVFWVYQRRIYVERASARTHRQRDEPFFRIRRKVFSEGPSFGQRRCVHRRLVSATAVGGEHINGSTLILIDKLASFGPNRNMNSVNATVPGPRYPFL